MTDKSSTGSTTRERLLDAALAIAGTQGIHSLTHGRVDRVAQVPRGTTSNHFRNRVALVHGTVEHLSSSELRLFADGIAPRTTDALVQALVSFAHEAAGPHRELTTARLAFFAEATHDDTIKSHLAEENARIRAWAAQILEDLGVEKPFETARRLLVQVDGAIIHRLALGEHTTTDDDLTAIIRSCLG